MPRAAVLLTAALAASAAPTPTPCAAPPGIVPVLPESLCYKDVVPTNPSGVSVRQYNGNPNATFVVASGRGAYVGGVQASIASVISYFAGSNDDQRNILSARTVPFAVVPSAGGSFWTAYMEVSPTQFPDDFLIPRPNPNQGVALEKVNANLGLVAVFAFNTTGFPYIENVEEACGAINESTLPAGYAINTTNPFSPTYAFYNGESSVNFTSECWMSVYKL
jgi:hypothetical protein